MQYYYEWENKRSMPGKRELDLQLSLVETASNMQLGGSERADIQIFVNEFQILLIHLQIFLNDLGIFENVPI